VADVSRRRDRAQLLLVGALALAVVFLSLSLLLNSVIYTENLATRQTHADAERAQRLHTGVVGGLSGAIEYANGRDTASFADRRDAYQNATDALISTLGNYSATDGVAASVERDGLHEGTRIVGNDSSTGMVDRTGSGDWTVATDSTVRAFRLDVNVSSVDAGDDVRITLDDGTPRDVVVEDTTDGDSGDDARVRIESPGTDPTCTLSDGRIDLTAGTVDGEYCHGLADVLPMASGGLHPGLVPALIDALGTNIGVQAGGGVHGHPDGTHAGATALRRAVEAATAGESLETAAAETPELATAMEKWGTDSPR